MHLQLKELVESLDSPGNLSVEELAELAQTAAQAMSDELTDWKVIFRNRKLSLPA
jgi:hypothetical protein